MSRELLKINEIFETIQGEGTQTGTASVFVRLQGCDVGCAFCDTKHTWADDTGSVKKLDYILNKNMDTEHWCWLQNFDLYQLINNKFKAKHIVFTGGEPCLYDLTRATNYFIQGKYTCQIETSGTEEIKCNPKTWVTVSPKINMSGGKKLIPSAIERANEIKMPIGKQKDIDILKDFIKDYQIKDKSIYLQPLSQSKKATELCVQSCIDYNWKISIQTHKYIGLR
tara:strand:- start:3864 stop:4538 length:675 start_codon:yes stop_codon:yes gene_type:complete